MNEKSNDEAVSTLNDLIETCRDGQKGFADAAKDAERADLKEQFHKYSTQRGAFVGELSALVKTLGGDPADSGHVAAAAHRGWMAVKTAVASRDDKAILEECERGEDYAKKAYTDALKVTMPASAQQLVSRQADDVRQAHDKIRDLRNAARAAS